MLFLLTRLIELELGDSHQENVFVLYDTKNSIFKFLK
jgi:hypothetical protein